MALVAVYRKIEVGETFTMSNYEAFRLVVWAIGLPIIIYLVINAVRKVQAIRELDRKLKEEAERNAKNPYAEMALMLEAQELLKQGRRK